MYDVVVTLHLSLTIARAQPRVRMTIYSLVPIQVSAKYTSLNLLNLHPLTEVV